MLSFYQRNYLLTLSQASLINVSFSSSVTSSLVELFGCPQNKENKMILTNFMSSSFKVLLFFESKRVRYITWLFFCYFPVTKPRF